MDSKFNMFFGIRQRVWAVGPATLLVFWVYNCVVLLSRWRDQKFYSKPRRFILGVLLALLLVVFIPLNVIYNAIFGSIIFAEWPKWGDGEFLTTHRLQRHKANPDPEYVIAAELLCGQLNKADPDHC